MPPSVPDDRRIARAEYMICAVIHAFPHSTTVNTLFPVFTKNLTIRIILNMGEVIRTIHTLNKLHTALLLLFFHFFFAVEAVGVKIYL